MQGPAKVHELESTVAALMARCAELEARLQSQVPAPRAHCQYEHGRACGACEMQSFCRWWAAVQAQTEILSCCAATVSLKCRDVFCSECEPPQLTNLPRLPHQPLQGQPAPSSPPGSPQYAFGAQPANSGDGSTKAGDAAAEQGEHTPVCPAGFQGSLLRRCRRALSVSCCLANAL